MRILHVLTTIDPAGGGPVEAARLFCLASGKDFEAEVLCLDDDVEPWIAEWPVAVHAVGHSRMYHRYSNAVVDWLRFHASRFDAVVVHGVWGYHLLGVYTALRKTRVPYFVILHGMLNPWFKRTFPLKHVKKIVAWHAMFRRAVAGAAAVLYLCEEERRLARLNFPIDCSKELLAPLGTSTSHVGPSEFHEQFPHLRGKRIVLFLGRICFMKGCDLLLEAFAGASRYAQDVHLVICGPDHEKLQLKLQQAARRLGIGEKVTWTGPLYRTAKRSAFAAADLFVLPSRCETFPVAVIEALASGIPVLVTRDINIHPEIEAARCGIVCDSTVDSVRQGLLEWLTSSRDVQAAFRVRARECHEACFSVDHAVKRHIEAIRSTCDSKPWAERLDRHASVPSGLRRTLYTIRRGSKELVRSSLSRGRADRQIRSGPLRGFKIHTSWHDYPGAILGTTERALLEWFQENVLQAETWIDVGAHYGYTAIALSRLVGPKGRVFAFEPVLATSNCIARTREINRLDQLTVVPIGLDSDVEARVRDLPVIRGMADSTIGSPERTERIRTAPLDSLWPALCAGSPQIHGIKIDVQGMEFGVLLGMREILERWKPKLAVEFHRGVEREPVRQLLKSCGYAIDCCPIDPSAPADTFADDMSYQFKAWDSPCASLYTPSFTARS